MEINEIVKSIIENDDMFNKFINFEQNKEIFNGFSYEEINNRIFFFFKELLDQKDFNNKYIMNVLFPNNLLKLKSKPLYNHIKEIQYAKITEYGDIEILKQHILTNKFQEIEKLYIKRCYENNESFKERINNSLNMIKEDNNFDRNQFDDLCYLTSIGYQGFDNQEVFEYIVKKIIDDEIEIEEYVYKGIIEKFALLTAKESKLENINIVLTSSMSKDTTGAYFPNELEFIKDKYVEKMIAIDSKELISKNICKNIDTIFHEVRHGIQMTEPEYENYYILQMIKDKYLDDKFGKDYYDDNYNLISFENDAYIVAAYNTMKFLESFTKKGKNKYKEEKEIKISNNRKIKNEDTKNLDDLFNKYVFEVLNCENVRDILLQEYNEDGKRKLITDFFKIRNDKNKKFYNELIYNHKYSFDEISENLEPLLFFNTSEEEKVEIIKKLSNDLSNITSIEVHKLKRFEEIKDMISNTLDCENDNNKTK